LILIRARRKDLDFLVDLWGRLSDCHREFYDYLEPTLHWREYMKTYFAKDLESEDKIILVAEDNRRYVGFIKGEIRMAPEVFNSVMTGYISEIFVEEGYRGSGLALQLTDGVIRWFKSRSISTVRLNVNSENSQASRFYEKLGFMEVNRTLRLNI